MQVLFDQGTPVPLRQSLAHHVVTTAYERGWSQLKNGDLLEAAEKAGVAVLITTDLNMKHQQNLARRSIALIVLSTTSGPRIQHALESVVLAVDRAAPGSYIEIDIP